MFLIFSIVGIIRPTKKIKLVVGEGINGIGINEGIENLRLLSSLIESGLLCQMCIYLDLFNNCYTNYWCQTLSYTE